jgi:O-glycosyl hydrolase
LHASGKGKPDRESLEQRRRLRDLARRFNVPLWMTEVSHSEVDPRSFDHLRGRAIHIHDEMVYADAAAFYGMNAMWYQKTHADHFAGRGGEDPQHFFTEQDTIVLIDNQARRVLITGMGYAIGHYARWIKRGANRLDAVTDDPLVQVTAFRNFFPSNLVLVAINNSPHPRTLNVNLDSVFLHGQVRGEQSHGHQRWQPLRKLDLQARDRFQATVPGLSVTTFAADLGVTS